MGVTSPAPMGGPVWLTTPHTQQWKLWVPKSSTDPKPGSSYIFGTVYSTGGPWPMYRVESRHGQQIAAFNTLDEAKAWLIATWRLET